MNPQPIEFTALIKQHEGMNAAFVNFPFLQKNCSTKRSGES